MQTISSVRNSWTSRMMAGVLLLMGAAGTVGAQTLLQDALRIRLEAGRATGGITAAGYHLYARNALPAFYQSRSYAPAWVGSTGPGPLVAHLLESVRNADREGLEAADYRLQSVQSLAQNKTAGLSDMVDLELLLTNAFLVYGSHLLQGRVNPGGLEPEWLANRRNADMTVYLGMALETGRVSETLASLAPSQARQMRSEM